MICAYGLKLGGLGQLARDTRRGEIPRGIAKIIRPTLETLRVRAFFVRRQA